MTTPLAVAEMDAALASPRRRAGARRRSGATSTRRLRPCAGGPTRMGETLRDRRGAARARPRRRLARRARRPAAHATASPPSTTTTSAPFTTRDGKPSGASRRRLTKGPDMADHPNSFDAARHAQGRRPRARRSSASTRCSRKFDVARLPFSLKILLENLLRTEGNGAVDGQPTSRRSPAGTRRPSPANEIAFTPARVVMQDFTGVPAVVDLAAMRDAMADLGGDPAKINPLVPAELVIDHSVQVDEFGTARRVRAATPSCEFERNRRALRVPALGPGRVRQLHGRAAGHRHRPPGQPRVPRARRLRQRQDRRRPTPTRSSAPTRTRR